MNITKKHLKQLIKEEFRKRLNEKRRQSGIPNLSRKKIHTCGDALNIIDRIAEDLDDSEKEEVRWLLTRVGEKFGLEPEEKDE